MPAPRINPVRRDREDRRRDVHPLDQNLARVLAALQIANQGFGIAVKFDEQDALQARTELDTLKAGQQEQINIQSEIATRTAQEEFKARPGEEEIRAGRELTRGAEVQRQDVVERDMQLKEDKFRAQKDVLAKEAALALGKDQAALQKGFRKDTRARKFLEAYDAADSIETLLDDSDPDPLRVNVAMIRAIRAAGEVGPITESDLARFSGDPSVAAIAKRAYDKYVEGEIPDFDVVAFRELGGLLKERAANRFRNQALAFAKTEGRRFGPAESVRDKILMPEAFLGGQRPANRAAPQGSRGSSAPVTESKTEADKDLEQFRRLRR